MNTQISEKARALLDAHNITVLPVDAEKIALKMGYKIIAPSTARRLQAELGLAPEDIARECFSFAAQGCDYIVISQLLAPDQRQNHIAHEIGHKVLEHTGDGDTSRQEDEADEFARHLRAPLAVLDKISIESAKDVAAQTGLDISAAQIVYRDLLDFRRQRNAVKSAEKTGRKFRRTIVRDWVANHKLHLAVALTAIVVAGIFVFCGFIFQNISSPNPASSVSQPQIVTHPQPDPSPQSGETITVPEDVTVYWTKAGSVYHLFPDCQHIRSSVDVLSGTIEAAQDAGKEVACKTCLSKTK